MRTSWQGIVAVPEDLIEEFLLRLPPADPASLVRAALVCKPWCHLISTPRFRRQFREFHRTPPMLGFLTNTTELRPSAYVARFVSTTSFRPPAPAEHRDWLVLDARHGRVLLRSIEPGSRPRLVVWDPVTDERRQLPEVPSLLATGWNAAVFCLSAATGSCDHLDCQRGPFAVVLVASDAEESTLSLYSSERCAWSDAWSERPLPSAWSDAWTVPSCYVNVAPSALVGNTLYFLIDLGRRILGCDLPTGETFVSFLPPDSFACDPVLMTMEDGALGVALGQGTRLSLWSMDMETSPDGDVVWTSPDGDVVWTRIRVIELEKQLPVKASSIYPTPVGFFPGVFFFNTNDGLFSINLLTDQAKKELENHEICVIKVVSYMSFYTPAPGLTITDEELAVDGSGA